MWYWYYFASLFFCRMTDAGVRHLVDGPCSAKLRELNLTNCIRVGDMAMVNIHKR
jgi:F-box/leucine-rich repeat protein 13